MSQPDTDLFEKFALISKYIIDEKLPITWIFRDNPETNEDSGWRILSGSEDEDFFDDQEDSFVGITIAELLRYEPSLVSLINSPFQSEFERTDTDSNWEAVSDELE